MSSEYSYDEQGQFFPFFVLTVSGLVTLPLTYSLLKPSKEDEVVAPRIRSDYKTQHDDVVKGLRAAQKRKSRKLKTALVAVAGWALMAAMVYLIATTQTVETKIWNPYDILGISDSSTEKQIKSHYRRLSVKFHPDKVRPDPEKNETAESLNDYYVGLTKAYQALTDEEVRNNYIQYGHPDGKQSFSIGIALPKFIIMDGNGKYIVFVYTALLGVLLPYLVGSWWYGTKRRSKEGVLMESANNLFQQYDDAMDENAIIAALSAGREYDGALKGDRMESGLSKVESRISATDGTSPFASGFSLKDKTVLEDLDSGVRRQALALLWAYLGRVELDDAALTKAKHEVGCVARTLNQSFAAIAIAYGNVGPILGSFKTNQHLIQALAPGDSPLLQLPYFNRSLAKVVDGDFSFHQTVQTFLDRPEAERRALVVGKDRLTDAQYKTVVSVGKQLPCLRVAKAFFKVTGERFIIPSSLVTLVIKGRFHPPGATSVPPVSETDLTDPDPAEDDLAANSGKKTADESTILPPLTHAPHYGRDHGPKWYAFLSDSKQGKMVVPPFSFAKFDKPIFTADGAPTFNMQTLKAQFAAPPQAGQYTFVLHVVCDSYVGFDTKMEVTLHVEEASKAAAMAAEDDISEPDEDSIAGQMHALKTGQAPKAPRRKEVDSDEDDSMTEEEDDTSETNTDTEDEG